MKPRARNWIILSI